MDVGALRQEHYNATLIHVQRPHADLRILRLRPDAGLPEYAAGQWIAVGLGAWEPRDAGLAPERPAVDASKLLQRPFSISSPILVPGDGLLRPEDEDFYEIYVALARAAPSPSPFLARLFALEAGARLWVADAPRGRNTLARVQPDDDVLFAATGTGEAPHNRMIWELLRRRHRGRIASCVCTRRRADQAYRDTHERLAGLFANYRYVPVATREAGEAGAHLQDLLRSGQLEHRAGFQLDPARARVFLCGHPGMIGAPRAQDGLVVYPQPAGMVEVLEKERGFRSDAEAGNIHFERY